MSIAGQALGSEEATFFKALSEPSRLAILARLFACEGACCVRDLAEGLPVDQSVVSRHLGTLRNASVVESERRGKEVYYSVRVESMVRTLRELADAIEQCAKADSCECSIADTAGVQRRTK